MVHFEKYLPQKYGFSEKNHLFICFQLWPQKKFRQYFHSTKRPIHTFSNAFQPNLKGETVRKNVFLGIRLCKNAPPAHLIFINTFL
jgi:hypothetical protein